MNARTTWDLTGLLALCLLFCVTLVIRWPHFRDGQGAQNVEATWHSLLTIRALEENPWSDHRGLPTVTLGNPRDKGVPWGAAVPTQTGDAIYTSFPAAGFLVPATLFRMAGMAPSIQTLSLFNAALGAVTAAGLFWLIRGVLLEDEGCRESVALCGSLLATAIALFSREALQSHGLVYWCHSLVQPLFVAGLWLLRGWLRAPDGRRNAWSAGLLGVVFLSALTEWTGYLFAGGIALCCWFGSDRSFRSAGLPLALLGVAALALVLTLLHLGMNVGWDATVRSLLARFTARGVARGSVLELCQGYWLSYGVFLPTLLVALVLYLIQTHRGADRDEQAGNRQGATTTTALLTFAALFPLVENGLLLQHATKFSFDRLKGIFPAAILLAVAYSRITFPWRLLVAAGICASSVQGVTSYFGDLEDYENWTVIHDRNQILVKELAQRVDLSCAVIAANVPVCGYLPLLVGRAAYHVGGLKDLPLILADQPSACAAVFLDARIVATDMPAIDRVFLLWPDGRMEQVGGQGTEIPSLEISPEFFVTDGNWNRGVSRTFPGFLLPNLERYVSQYEVGSMVEFCNGERRRIVRMKTHGRYVHVVVDGAILDAEVVGSPAEYRIVQEMSRSNPVPNSD